MFDFFTITDLVSFAGWLIIVCIGAFLVRVNNRDNDEFKYYLPHFFYKLLMGFGFALVYMFYYERHGDTVYYWDGARKLSMLLFENPSAYFQEIFVRRGGDTIPQYYRSVGYPPSWIYSEANSWFVCKIASFLSFFTFGSYITLNLLFSVISTWVSWKFFRFINSILKTETKYIALACLFIPSVAFWCTGLIKDTIALSAIMVLVMCFFKLLHKSHSSLLKIGILFLFALYLLIAIRPFLLIATFIPFFVILTFRLNKHKPAVIRFLTRFVGIGISVAAMLFYFGNNDYFSEFSAERIWETAEVIQKDMQNNVGYTGKRYDLGISDFAETNWIKVFPAAIVVTLFRPFIWEVNSVFMLLNGIENLLIAFLTLRLAWTVRKKGSLKELFSNDFYIFAILFAIILGFFVGLTSGLFGTLVRLKAPVLPFFMLFVFYPYLNHLKNQKN